jgi:hypothetical protein
MAEAQDHYVIAVRGLTPGEPAALGARLEAAGLGHTELVSRAYSRSQVDELAARVAHAVNTVGNWSWFGPIYRTGVVDVGVRNPDCAILIAAAVEAATGRAPMTGDAAEDLFGTPNPTEELASQTPVVTVRVGEVVHLPDFVSTDPVAGPAALGHSIRAKEAAGSAAKPAKVTASAVKTKLIRTAKPILRVTVKVPGVKRPAGTVRVSWGSSFKAVRLKASAKGKVTVRLPRVARGMHRFTVTYADSSGTVRGATAKAVRVRVL